MAEPKRLHEFSDATVDDYGIIRHALTGNLHTPNTPCDECATWAGVRGMAYREQEVAAKARADLLTTLEAEVADFCETYGWRGLPVYAIAYAAAVRDFKTFLANMRDPDEDLTEYKRGYRDGFVRDVHREDVVEAARRLVRRQHDCDSKGYCAERDDPFDALIAALDRLAAIEKENTR